MQLHFYDATNNLQAAACFGTTHKANAHEKNLAAPLHKNSDKKLYGIIAQARHKQVQHLQPVRDEKDFVPEFKTTRPRLIAISLN